VGARHARDFPKHPECLAQSRPDASSAAATSRGKERLVSPKVKDKIIQLKRKRSSEWRPPLT